jgi:hypothetical protein
MDMAAPGDLVVAFIDRVQGSIDLVRAYAAEVAAGGSGLACTLGPAPGPARVDPVPESLRAVHPVHSRQALPLARTTVLNNGAPQTQGNGSPARYTDGEDNL